MKKNKLDYNQYVAFINRETELKELRNFVNKEPCEILFIHGPKSSGKTTLLYKFFEQIEKEQKLDVKFLNLREKLIGNYKDFIRIFFGIDYSRSKEDVKEKRQYNLFNFFKLSVEVLKGMESGELDPFEIMKREFIKLTGKGIKPVIIIDELQAIDHIYISNGNERQVIIELFNFFVAMTKESHLAHIIVASSDGYFLNTVYTDSRLKQTSEFYKVDFLPKEDVMEWLMNLGKYSKIKDYTLTREDAEKIWDTVGGSMWEIQNILGHLFNKSIDDVLTLHKKKIKGIIAHYIMFDKKRRDVLRVINEQEVLREEDTSLETLGIELQELKELLKDMVRNNILYFDPIEAVYYPQARSYQWGIRLYFESSVKKKKKTKKRSNS
ncbi:MAG: AAA family ATPase [Candidatus Aminicenantes bacterium]|nr:AAA family ATPase [Candidatus Aminicenantes bacterium]NIM79761.1 AAA family ATPase [Candidatus Aminicenantes bacterium]NIN19093.1 AAA family ATPase [Candidatus Aminicenantes bacterium]NIN42995.1 AAA family ATPase [Candidatus Aminicenantes bacterium]NIN85738.1 AAA family ATPase [Candidatus Aminicenantes bacterium]